MSVNKIILLGRVGKDAELKALPTGSMYLSFSLATSEKYKDKNGLKQESTDWHNISYFTKGADKLAQYIRKGNQLYVEGKISYSEYEIDGVKKYFTNINANNIEFIGSKNEPIVEETNADTNFTTDQIPF